MTVCMYRDIHTLQPYIRDVLISQIYFWNRTLIRTGYADCLLASSQHNLYDIYLLLCMQY